MTSETMTPAQAEQRDYAGTSGLLAIREQEFRGAPAYIPQESEWAGLKEMARSLCITEFVPKDMRGKPFAVLGALLMGRDLGLPPTMALRRIYVVNGRPALETAVKVALVRRAGHRIRVVEWDTEHCTVEGWRKGDPGDELMQVTYAIADAKLAGDYDKPGDMYKKRPRQMVYNRAAGLLCDTYFPDVTLGLPDPEEAATLPGEVIDAQWTAMDRAGQLPSMPTDTPLTDEERAAVDERRQKEAAERLAAFPPPTPPRSTRRGKGPAPSPQQGSDTSGPTGPSGAVPAGSPATAASPAPATAAAEVSYVSEAQMARDLGLQEEAEALERGEPMPNPAAARIEEARRRAETASTAPEGPEPSPAAPGHPEVPPGQAGPAEDPFAAEADPGAGSEPVDISGLLQLRQQAETYADFLTRKKLERDHKPPGSVQALHDEAMTRLDVVAKGLLGHGYTEATEVELRDKVVPWLRERYAKEGGRDG